MLAKSDIMILTNEKTTFCCTVVLDGLSFLKSRWQFYSVNLKMINCYAAILVMKIEDVRNVTIENSIFGNWLFDQVQHVSLRNCSGSIVKGFSTLLAFYKASGFLENITIKDMVFTNEYEGIWVENNSYVMITKSNLVNNTVIHGLIKLFNSSNLEMSDCTVQNNNAKKYAGAIHVQNSTVHLKETNFNGNKAVYRGGAIYLKNSFLYMKNCIFSNNQVKFGYPINHELDDGSGGAIGLFNSTLKGTNVNFTYNKANYGGAVCIVFHSKVNMQCSNFSHNTAASGSATFGSTFSTFLCKNCSLYQNQNVGRRNHTVATVIYVVQHSMINISGFKCENHRGLNCISAYNNSIVIIVNAFFSMNLGGTILIKNNSHLVTVGSSFFNNTELEHGGAIFSVNSTLDISHSVFYHNRAKEGGSLYVMFSTAYLNNCTFKNNSNAAIIIWNSTASAVKCTFESNSSPVLSGALLVHNFSFVNVSRTIFLKNSGTTGGAIGVNRSSSSVISSCYFSGNTAPNTTDKNFTGRGGGGGGGAIFVEGSTVKLFASRFYNNCADNMGGSVYSANETLLLIEDTDFENNRAGSHGGGIAIYDQSYITIHGCSLTNNSVLGYVESKGGGLFARGNCTVFISNVCITESNAQEGTAIYILDFCQITMFNSSFMANIYSTIVLLSSVSSHINGCRFFNNSSPLAVSSASSANVTNTVFYYNIG